MAVGGVGGLNVGEIRKCARLSRDHEPGSGGLLGEGGWDFEDAFLEHRGLRGDVDLNAGDAACLDIDEIRDAIAGTTEGILTEDLLVQLEVLTRLIAILHCFLAQTLLQCREFLIGMELHAVQQAQPHLTLDRLAMQDHWSRMRKLIWPQRKGE